MTSRRTLRIVHAISLYWYLAVGALFVFLSLDMAALLILCMVLAGGWIGYMLGEEVTHQRLTVSHFYEMRKLADHAHKAYTAKL